MRCQAVGVSLGVEKHWDGQPALANTMCMCKQEGEWREWKDSQLETMGDLGWCFETGLIAARGNLHGVGSRGP